MFIKYLYVIYNQTGQEKRQRFSNRGLSLFFLMGIFLNNPWLISNILKSEDCKIFTKLLPS